MGLNLMITLCHFLTEPLLSVTHISKSWNKYLKFTNSVVFNSFIRCPHTQHTLLTLILCLTLLKKMLWSFVRRCWHSKKIKFVVYTIFSLKSHSQRIDVTKFRFILLNSKQTNKTFFFIKLNSLNFTLLDDSTFWSDRY